MYLPYFALATLLSCSLAAPTPAPSVESNDIVVTPIVPKAAGITVIDNPLHRRSAQACNPSSCQKLYNACFRSCASLTNGDW